MATYEIARITPSRYGDGDRWRVQVDGDWFDAYLTPDAGDIQPGAHEIEWKTSPKTGKHYIVAIDGRYRTSQQRQAAPAAPPPPAPAPRSAPAPAAAAGLPAPSSGQREMWIMATSIAQAVIAKFDQWEHGQLVELARESAMAARAAARVFEGAPVDQARAALDATAPAPAPRRAPNPPQPDGDPGEPVGGLPFDDDIPF